MAERSPQHRDTTHNTSAGATPQHGHGVTASHRLRCRESSLSSGSLTGIPAALLKTAKGLDAEHAAHSSSENVGSQPQSLPSGCFDVQQHNRACGDSGACGPPVAAVAEKTLLMSAVGSTAGLSHSVSTATDSGASAPLEAASGASTTAANNLAAFPARRGPKHALLSHAEQYRTLQPYLRRRFRNRRWRLIFSSEVHGQHLLDRCQRAFREEEAQWHSMLNAKLHHSLFPDGALPELDVEAEEYSTSSPTFGLLPLLALMETTIVVPAPKHAATTPATLHDAASSFDASEEGAAEHARLPPSAVVVDSHVCVGLYLEHRPAPDTVTSYRKSEIFFFLFQSPIHPASATATTVASDADVTAAAAAADERVGVPVVSAPPQSITQTSRRMSGETGDVFRDAGEEWGGRQRRQVQREDCAPRTQSHRLRAADSPAQPSAFSVSTLNSPPAVNATNTVRERREDDMAGVAQAFDRHGGVVEERRMREAAVTHVDPLDGPPAGATAGSAFHQPSLTGILSSSWQQQVGQLATATTSPSPHQAHTLGEENDADTFSSTSAVAAVDAPSPSNTTATRDSSSQQPRSVTRVPAVSHAAAVPPPLPIDGVLPAWAIAAVDAVRSPNTPVSPQRQTRAGFPGTADDAAGRAEAVLVATSRSHPAPSSSVVDARPLRLSNDGPSLAMDDDLVSATTTVVSATSATGMAWREDEDLSSYWPEAAQTASGGLPRSHLHGLSGGLSVGHGREWFSPANGPQLPPLSRVSSFGGEDTAECLTPRLSREAGSAFAVADSADRRMPLSLLPPAGGVSPQLPGLGGTSATGNASVASLVSLPVHASSGMTRSTSLPNDVSVFVASALDQELPAPASSLRDGRSSSGVAATAVRPVSTRVEVLSMVPVSEQLLDGRVASGDGGLHSELPSRTASQLVLSGEGTIDVYCTSAGALYVWDRHREHTRRAENGPASAAADSASSEHEFVYQRDASGVRLNIGYFAREGYGAAPAAAATTAAPSAPVGDTGYASLFAYLRAQAQQETKTSGDVTAANSRSNNTSTLTTEVVRCPLVRMQVCAISSRAMPSVYQNAASSAALPTLSM